MTEPTSNEPALDLSDPDVRKAWLLKETAQIPWRELQRQFAAGATIAVAPELSLVSVGAEVMADNKAQMAAWLSAGQVAPVNDHQAREWYDADATLWAVVLSPWVFVQPAR